MRKIHHTRNKPTTLFGLIYAFVPWKNDEKLKSFLEICVKKNFKREEILDFVARHFPQKETNREKKSEKGHFTSKGIGWIHSLDGHRKLMGYQRRF